MTNEHTGGAIGLAPAFSRAALQELLWDDAGLVRDEVGLEHAASVVAVWRAQQRIPVTEHDFEDENLLLVAEHLVAAARARRESVGAHFRSDGTPAQAPALRATTRGAAAPRAHTADLSKEPVAC